MSIRLEHANIQVSDVDAVLGFLQTAFPEFQIRYDSGVEDAERWVHVGDDRTYLAVNRATTNPAEPWQPYSGKPGVNHLGFVIDDAAALRRRMLAAGYAESTVPNNHPARRRVYFMDPTGNDWEFVQYLSDDVRKRNDYSVDQAPSRVEDVKPDIGLWQGMVFMK